MLYTDEFKLALSESIDGPHGYVIAKDRKTGKILVNKHNMIVQTGKEYLWGLFLTQQGAPQEAYDKDLTFLTLGRAVFSDKTTEVTYSDNVPTNPEGAIAFKLSYDNTNSDKVSSATFSEYNGHKFLAFTLSISGSTIENISMSSISSLELQLVARESGTSSNNGVYKLFSRIRFDTIPLTQDSDIEIVYYIYF